MVIPTAGAVVLVQFPFSDLSETKLRPAIALADAGRGDWILCQVTSQPYGDPRAIRLERGIIQTMTQEELFREITTLPAEVQKQVFDFITFLRSQYPPAQETFASSELRKEPFVGIWRDRKDIQDSTTWVRNLRTQE